MKRYVKNVIIYLAALFGIIAFLSFFSAPLKIYDSVKDTWYRYQINAFLGENSKNFEVYKGAFVPAIGFILPVIMAIVLIVESFKPSWSRRITVLNTILAVLYFVCAVLVLLTKELFLNANSLDSYLYVKNGGGPIMSAIFSTLSGISLLFVTWFPSKQDIDFIEN